MALERYRKTPRIKPYTQGFQCLDCGRCSSEKLRLLKHWRLFHNTAEELAIYPAPAKTRFALNTAVQLWLDTNGTLGRLSTKYRCIVGSCPFNTPQEPMTMANFNTTWQTSIQAAFLHVQVYHLDIADSHLETKKSKFYQAILARAEHFVNKIGLTPLFDVYRWDNRVKQKVIKSSTQ